MKPICIKEELYKNAPFDFVGITARLQLYFAPGSLKKMEKPSNNKSSLKDAHLPGVLQSWMSVNFQLDSDVEFNSTTCWFQT